MRIIHVIPGLNVGGAETMMKNLSIEQMKQGHSVSVIAFYECDSFIKESLESVGIEIMFLNKKIGFDFTTILQLKEIFDNKNPDIIHTHSHVLPYVFLASRSRKIIHTIHTIAEKERSGIAVYLTRMIYHSRRVIPVAISNEIRKSISQFHHIPENSIPVVLNGVPISHYYEKESYNTPEKARIIHVGSLIPLKNHELMINVACKLKKQNIKFKMEFAGVGYLKDKLQEQVIDLHLEDCVEFVGLKDDISVFLKEADLFIFPSQYEGVPMSLIEAMASGLPIIASNVGGIPDMIADGINGILIQPNEENLYDAITKLINDKKLRKTIGEAAIAESKRFSSSVMCEKYISIYRNSKI